MVSLAGIERGAGESRVHRRIQGNEPWSGQANEILLGTKLCSTNLRFAPVACLRTVRVVKGLP